MPRDYTKIKAWQLSDKLALSVYKATKGFPKSEVWGRDQPGGAGTNTCNSYI